MRVRHGEPDSSVAAGTATVNEFTPPANARYIRFQTFQADSSSPIHDLDMFVYRFNPDPTVNAYQLIATSGGPDANEVVNTTSTGSLTAGAKFKVYILGCGVDAGGGDFTLFAWAITTTPSHGFKTTPADQSVTVGQVIPETFSWQGLPSGNRYLGRVSYVDPATTTPAMPSTIIAVSTR